MEQMMICSKSSECSLKSTEMIRVHCDKHKKLKSCDGVCPQYGGHCIPYVDPILTDEEQDNCCPTNEELAAYLATPDDEIAAHIRAKYPNQFPIIGKQILWGMKIAKAKHAKTTRAIFDELEKSCPHKSPFMARSIGPIYPKQRECLICLDALKRRFTEEMNG